MSAFNGSARAKTLLEKLTDFPNVPRKKPKFMNFMRNSFRSYGVTDAMLNEIWTVIEKMDAPTQQSNGAKNTGAQKRPLEVEEPQAGPQKKVKDEESPSAEFDWLAEIKQECAKKDSNQIKLNKLEKKVNIQLTALINAPRFRNMVFC